MPSPVESGEVANPKREREIQQLPKRRAEATLRKQVRLTGETIDRIHE